MYRIMIARSGYYYVQQREWSGWRKVGGFCQTRAGARRLVNDLRDYRPAFDPGVVEYC